MIRFTVDAEKGFRGWWSTNKSPVDVFWEKTCHVETPYLILMRPLLLDIALLLLLASLPARAQTGPLSPDVIDLPELGRLRGLIPLPVGAYEYFGGRVAGVGDVDGDHLDDWIVRHRRTDLSGNRGFTELLLYRGVRDTLPKIETGERIGAREDSSYTELLTSGDFDADGHVDLVTTIAFYRDTSFGNNDGLNIFRVVVFWGNERGEYSCDDTSHLSCDADVWLSLSGVTVMRVADRWTLVISPSLGFSRFKRAIVQPRLVMYALEPGQRWGRNGVSRSPIWRMWNTPDLNQLRGLDCDGDGAEDIALIWNSGSNASTGGLSVLYGRSNDFPDTTELEFVDLLYSNGHKVDLFDVTGDGIPELITHAGSEEYIKVFIGLRGQRLLEQYGSGIEPPHPGEERWWGRPWAKLRLPYHFGWGSSLDWVLPIGDCDMDSIAEVAVYAGGTVYIYGTGDHFDEYADAVVDMQSSGTFEAIASAGNIDGTGRPAKLIGTGGGLIIATGTWSMPRTIWGEAFRRPDGTDRPASVGVPGRQIGDALALWLVPNIADGWTRVVVSGTTASRSGHVVVATMLGEVVRQMPLPDSELFVDLHSLPAGRYVVRYTNDGRAATAPLTILHR